MRDGAFSTRALRVMRTREAHTCSIVQPSLRWCWPGYSLWHAHAMLPNQPSSRRPWRIHCLMLASLARSTNLRTVARPKRILSHFREWTVLEDLPRPAASIGFRLADGTLTIAILAISTTASTRRNTVISNVTARTAWGCNGEPWA